MGILDIMNRIVSICLGIVSSLVGIATLVEKCKPYIKTAQRTNRKKTHQLAYRRLMGHLMIA